jgi:hypothetical protein
MMADEFLQYTGQLDEKVVEFENHHTKWLAQQERNGTPFKGDAQSEQTFRSIRIMRQHTEGVATAQRFVLSPQVVDAAMDFANTQGVTKHALDYIFLPAETTWIEWAGKGMGSPFSNRHGLLLKGVGVGHGKLSVGLGCYACDATTNRFGGTVGGQPFHFDLHDYVLKMVKVMDQTLDDDEIIGGSLASVGRFLVCVLALINTPRVSQVIHHPIADKLNRSRLKRGKVPLMSWSDVTIRPDIGWMPKSVHEEGVTGERRRHHVRTFMRLKMGKVEIVKPHWRGNREKGYVQHRHVVRMTDEESGAWKGGVLPGPEIMPQGYVVPGDEEQDNA